LIDLLMARPARFDHVQLRCVIAALMIQLALDRSLSPPVFRACASVFRAAREAGDHALRRRLIGSLSAVQQAGQAAGPASGPIGALVERLCNLHPKLQHLREGDFARELHVDPAHLGRCLRAHTGVRFREWCWAISLRTALPFLVDSDQPLKWIADEAGFGAAGTRQLARCVQRVFGLAPGAFRAVVQGLRANPLWAACRLPTQELS
jgi:AraC-like DNA-binding protein